MSNADSPFNWKGKPSIFTQSNKQESYGEAMVRRHLSVSLRKKLTPISLPGGSLNKEPGLMTRETEGGSSAKRRRAKVREVE